MARKKAATDIDFEKALRELEALVERLEQGELTLEDSLKQFERGIALTRACQQALKDAEQKVQILSEREGKLELQPFESQTSADTESEHGG